MIDYILFQRKTSRNFSFEIEIDLLRSVCRWWHQVEVWILLLSMFKADGDIQETETHSDGTSIRLNILSSQRQTKWKNERKEKKMLIASIIPSKRYCQTNFPALFVIGAQKSALYLTWCLNLSQAMTTVRFCFASHVNLFFNGHE